MDEAEGLSEAQIRHMADRFLGWKLPKNFRPDNGISYTRPKYHPSVDATPNGTNLFDATQATEMVRYMAEGLPRAESRSTPDREGVRDAITGKPVPGPVTSELVQGVGLNHHTAAMVNMFALELARKLRRAEEKYGFADGWRTEEWEDECRRQLRAHMDKGDPLDVAAYAAFCWVRGWSTAPSADALARPASSAGGGLEEDHSAPVLRTSELASGGKPALDAPESPAGVTHEQACHYADTSEDPLAAMLREADTRLRAKDYLGASVSLHGARLGQAYRALSSEPAPAPSIAAGWVVADVESVRGWLASLPGLDLDEIAADGGVTVGMVAQQEAREMAARLARALAAAPSPVVEGGWLPIETAPRQFDEATRISKDITGLSHDIVSGPSIVVAVDSLDYPGEDADFVKVAWCIGPHGECWWDIEGEEPLDRDILGWMPLPPAPVERDAQGVTGGAEPCPACLGEGCGVCNERGAA